MTALLFVLVGISMGLVTGLFGIGGGLFAVPFLLLILTQSGYNAAPIAPTAVFTSLAVICCTTSVAAYSNFCHFGEKMVVHVRQIAPGIAIGSVIGSLSLINISEYLLRIIIGILVIWVGYSILSKRVSKGRLANLVSGISPRIMGTPIGAVSAMLGIGGGLMTVPFLRARGVDLKHAIAVATGCSVIVGVCGIVNSVLLSLLREESPLYYIHPFAFLSLTIFGSLFSYISVRYMQRLETARLRLIFSCFLLILGFYLILNTLSLW